MPDTSTLDPQYLRSCLSRFVTGVAIVSYRADGQTRGLTVNSFTAVSLAPPLVLVSVARTARAAAHLDDTPFSVSVLGASQLDLALLFAGQAYDPVQVTWQRTGDDLAPTVPGALATFRCRPWQSYDGGDHALHVGHVVTAGVRDGGGPLVFDRGRLYESCRGVEHHPRSQPAAGAHPPLNAADPQVPDQGRTLLRIRPGARPRASSEGSWGALPVPVSTGRTDARPPSPPPALTGKPPERCRERL